MRSRTSGATPTGRSRRCSKTKDGTQANLLYYQSLIPDGLLNAGRDQDLRDADRRLDRARTGGNVSEAAGEIMNSIPDLFVGAAADGARRGQPAAVGTKLARRLRRRSPGSCNTLADIAEHHARA